MTYVKNNLASRIKRTPTPAEEARAEAAVKAADHARARYMLEKTDDTRDAMQHAQRRARKVWHKYIGYSH